MAATKFTFDTVFAAKEDVVSEAARARQKKALTQAEIDRLCAEAHERGMRAGEVLALEAVAEATADTVCALRAAMQQSRESIETVRSDAAHLALAAARTLARSALDAWPVAEVEAVLRQSLHQAIGEPRVVLRVHPRVASALEPKIADIAQSEGFEGRVQISPEPGLKNADCRIEWRGGGLERSEHALETALADVIARRFSHILHPSSED